MGIFPGIPVIHLEEKQVDAYSSCVFQSHGLIPLGILLNVNVF